VDLQSWVICNPVCKVLGTQKHLHNLKQLMTVTERHGKHGRRRSAVPLQDSQHQALPCLDGRVDAEGKSCCGNDPGAVPNMQTALCSGSEAPSVRTTQWHRIGSCQYTCSTPGTCRVNLTAGATLKQQVGNGSKQVATPQVTMTSPRTGQLSAQRPSRLHLAAPGAQPAASRVNSGNNPVQATQQTAVSCGGIGATFML